MGAIRIFRDANNHEYALQEDQTALRRVGHKALWEYGPEGSKGWLATWDSYVILAQPSGNMDAILAQFDQINYVGEAMRAYSSFQGFQCPLCGHPFFAEHVCS